MPRQSISLTPPNDAWLKSQVDCQEYASKSDAVNDLIRRAREREAIRVHLMKAEEGGFTSLTIDEIVEETRRLAREHDSLSIDRNGKD